jgi:hypothetical protein
LTRVAGDYVSFQLAEQLSSRAIAATGLWAPARIGLALAVGMAGSTVFDRLMGEGAEVAGSEGYNRARDFFSPRGPLSNPEKAIKRETTPAAVLLNPAQLGDLGKKPSMTNQFIERHQELERLLNSQ